MSAQRLPRLAARRALTRWGLRQFRREWRQQALVLALLTVGTCAAVFASTAAFNLARPLTGQFGSAEHRLELTVLEPQALDGYLAEAEEHFGRIEVISRRSVPLPGSIDTVEVRSQDRAGPFGAPMLRLVSGRVPATVDEVALTDGTAALFDVTLGETVPLGDHRPVVVGMIENPGDLDDEFVLAEPSGGAEPEVVTILFDASEDRIRTFRPANDPGPIFLDHAAQSDQTVAALVIFTIATVGMLLVGLVASAGFVVIAQRRQRQLGMLAAIGATPRHVRVVVLTNGALVGSVAAAVGIGLALGLWTLVATTFEGAAGHRIARLHLPWWLIGAGFALSVATATASAWWPARAASRVPIVDALSARPARRETTRRSVLAAAVLVVASVVCLGVGVDPSRDYGNPLLVIAGIVTMVVGVVLMASPSIAVLASRSAALPVAVRLAVRDLARNQARSGAALAAATLGLAIAVSVVVVAAAAEHGADEGNLSDHQLIAWVGEGRPDLFVPDRPPASLDDSGAAVDDFAASLGEAEVLTLEVAVDPTVIQRQGTDMVRPFLSLGRRVGENTLRFTDDLYLATPELLAHLDLSPEAVGPETILLSEQEAPAYVVGDADHNPFRANPVPAEAVEPIDTPPYRSAPRALLTEHGLEEGGWQRATAGWLIESEQPFSDTQLAAARDMAASAGLTIEARDQQPGLVTVRTAASIAGVLLALGILAMTVGLLRAEATRDLRTLAAAGAGSRVRRALTATTAGALALLATVLGTGAAYLALLAGYWPDLDRLGNIPVAHLLAIVIALPAIATLAGWTLAGREPATLGRQPIE